MRVYFVKDYTPNLYYFICIAFDADRLVKYRNILVIMKKPCPSYDISY